MKGLGAAGEDMAVKLLSSKGFEIIERNFSLRMGEIDIVAKDGLDLVFIEVKTRASKEFGEPFEAVSLLKQKKIYRMAEAYLAKNPFDGRAIRFDVVSILLGPERTDIEHIKNAF